MPPKAALHRLDGKRDLFELHGLDQVPVGACGDGVLVDEDLGAQLPEPLSEKRRVLLVIVDQGQGFRIHGIAPGRFWFDVTDRG